MDEDKKYIVYAHINKENGKMYIGQTCNIPEKRWANGNGYRGQMFYNAIQKYSWDGFDHEIIATNLTKDEANNFEMLLIEKLNTTNINFGYNIALGGKNAPMSDETKRKIGESNTGAERPKGVDSPCSIQVVQYDMSGNKIKIWDCITDVMRELSIDASSIVKCCNNKFRKAGGYIWRYLEDELTDEHIAWCNDTDFGKSKRKSVAQYSLSGEFIAVFESITDASFQTGASFNGISRCCKSEQSACGGYT